MGPPPLNIGCWVLDLSQGLLSLNSCINVNNKVKFEHQMLTSRFLMNIQSLPTVWLLSCAEDRLKTFF